MIHTSLLLILGLLLPPHSAGKVEQQSLELARSIASTYEANRNQVASFGSFTFGMYDGLVRGSIEHSPETIAGLDRERMSQGTGRYIFNGKKRLFDHSYSLQEDVKQKVQINPRQSESPIFSFRQLTDGEINLFDGIGSSLDNKSVIYTPTLVSASHFFRHLDFPLRLGDPPPPGEYFSGLLREFLGGQSKWTLQSCEPGILLGEFKVVKIIFKNDAEGLTYFAWVDLECGAIPRLTYIFNKEGKLQEAEVLQDIRFVGGRGWFPFNAFTFIQNIPPVPNRPGVGIRFWEKEIKEAEMDSPPADSEFVLVFPEPIKIVNAETQIVYPETDRWDLNAISSKSVAKGRPLGMAAEPPVSEPLMPGEQAQGWGNLIWYSLGSLCLALAGWLFVRRLQHAKTV